MKKAKDVILPVITDDVRRYLNFPKVELHVHLDGAVRHETLLELSREKNIDMDGAKTVEDVRDRVITTEPAGLAKLLSAFRLFLPVLVGDSDALERIAYELCEDESKSGVIYFEARYSPHLFCNTVDLSTLLPGKIYSEKGPLSPRDVVEAVNRGFERGEKVFQIKARTILCAIHAFPSWNKEVLELAIEYKDKGVVGIDIAGCELGADEQYPDSVAEIFQEAAKRGVHRTVHAGESGEATSVINAVESMQAERIGHGYRILRDQKAYQKYAIEKRIHFETCPISSVMTSSVELDWRNHPIRRFATDAINFSINTDDPTCLDNSLLSEYQLAHSEIGLPKKQLWQCSLNAARSCFADEELKREVIRTIKAYKI